MRLAALSFGSRPSRDMVAVYARYGVASVAVSTIGCFGAMCVQMFFSKLRQWYRWYLLEAMDGTVVHSSSGDI